MDLHSEQMGRLSEKSHFNNVADLADDDDDDKEKEFNLVTKMLKI